MGNSLRCCLACILPCGALDVIRIVHLNGYVEEITHPITAGEVLQANPNHVLSKPCSQGVARKILILSPESQLKRGSIYFLIPASSLPAERKNKGSNNICHKKSSRSTNNKSNKTCFDNDLAAYCEGFRADLDTVYEKKSSTRRRRRRRRAGSFGAWRPHLESITED